MAPFRISLDDPYKTTFDMVTRAINQMIRDCENKAIDDAFKEYGYVKERTCNYDYFQDAQEANWLDKVECQGYHVLKCGHRVPGNYFERPNYCCVCGAKVIE